MKRDKNKGKRSKKSAKPPLRIFLRRRFFQAIFIVFSLIFIWMLAHRFIPVYSTHYMRAESTRIGEKVDYHWTPIEEISPYLLRAAVAAEDANFCRHWGFDMQAIRSAIVAGSVRGGSTITQQTVKNTYLWHGRSWIRKALEAVLTPILELTWPKERILEVYLNIAEFDEGVFGAEAASQHYFGISPAELSPRQAAYLAAILPSPKTRSASRPSAFIKKRAIQIQDGAATIAKDERSQCFISMNK